LPPGTTRLVYQADFEKPSSDWPVRTSGNVLTQYVGGEYRVQVIPLNTFHRPVAPPSLSDFHAEVQARYEGADREKAYGLVFRYEDADNFYRFEVNPFTGKYRFLKRVHGVVTIVLAWTFSPAINRGDSPNLLTVVARSQLISLYANGISLSNITDSALNAGRIGPLTFNEDDPIGAIAYFDNLRLFEWDPLAPMPTATPAPTPTPTPVPTATPTPIPLPPGTTKLLYRDDFDDPASGWVVRTSGDYQVGYVGGEYRMLVKPLNSWVIRPAPPSFGDVHAEVQARYQSGDQAKYYGLVFRYEDSDNFYAFLVNPISGKYTLMMVLRGQQSNLISFTPSPSINKGPGTNLLRVVARGPNLELYVNNVLVGKITDSTFAAGRVGLIVWNDVDPNGAEVFFDNLRVFELK
jgi:hypothetical protein